MNMHRNQVSFEKQSIYMESVHCKLKEAESKKKKKGKK